MPKYKGDRSIYDWKDNFINGAFKVKHIINYKMFFMVKRLKKLAKL